MGSLIEELRRREAAARAEADRLRARIQELAEELDRAEEQVVRLVIALEEVTRILEAPVPVEPPAGGPAGLTPRPGSPIGTVTIPPWQEGASASVLPQSYHWRAVDSVLRSTWARVDWRRWPRSATGARQ